jgi:hypothetical protein
MMFSAVRNAALAVIILADRVMAENLVDGLGQSKPGLG